MKILRIAIAGAVSYFAYKAWRKRVAQDDAGTDDVRSLESVEEHNDVDRADDMRAKGRAAVDHGQRTQPHGDPLADDLVDDDADLGGSPQSSRSFGGT